MDAVVLVGGEGTRLRPLTETAPKQLLPVVDRPMIEHVVGWLARHGITRAVLSLGYRPDDFRAAYPRDEIAGCEIAFAVEPELLDTAGAVAFAAREAALEERFLVVNGDVLSDFDISSLVSFHESHGGRASIELTPVEDPSAFGVVPTDVDGRVEAFIEKPPPGTAPTNLISAGCYLLEPEVLGMIPSGRRVSIERETFPALVSEGSLFALSSTSYWLDTGTPQKYLQASRDVLAGRRTRASRPAGEEGPAGCFMAAGAVLEGELSPPGYLGPGARLGPGAVLSDSVLCEGAELAEGARVSGSMVMAGASVGEGAIVEDSIVGPGAVVGAACEVRGFSVIGAGFEVEPSSRLTTARLGRS